jgi:hypothetical protein
MNDLFDNTKSAAVKEISIELNQLLTKAADLNISANVMYVLLQVHATDVMNSMCKQAFPDSRKNMQ